MIVENFLAKSAISADKIILTTANMAIALHIPQSAVPFIAPGDNALIFLNFVRIGAKPQDELIIPKSTLILPSH